MAGVKIAAAIGRLALGEGKPAASLAEQDRIAKPSQQHAIGKWFIEMQLKALALKVLDGKRPIGRVFNKLLTDGKAKHAQQEFSILQQLP